MDFSEEEIRWRSRTVERYLRDDIAHEQMLADLASWKPETKEETMNDEIPPVLTDELIRELQEEYKRRDMQHPTRSLILERCELGSLQRFFIDLADMDRAAGDWRSLCDETIGHLQNEYTRRGMEPPVSPYLRAQFSKNQLSEVCRVLWETKPLQPQTTLSLVEELVPDEVIRDVILSYSNRDLKPPSEAWVRSMLLGGEAQSIIDQLASVERVSAFVVRGLQPYFGGDKKITPIKKEDVVNHPSHYNQYFGFEVIDVCEQLRAPDGSGGYNRGNAFKYLARAGWKNPEKHIEDLQKARFYIEREIERIEFETHKSLAVDLCIVPQCAAHNKIG